jgi:hypothetical protein
MDSDYFCSEYPNPLDLTGRYSTNNLALEHLRNGGSGDKHHYATAPFYSQLHRFDNSAAASDATGFGSYNRFNSLCFQGHQAMYNTMSGAYDVIQQNTGHWGPRVYQGCGKVRKGLQMMLEPTNYSSVNGTGASRSTVTIGF